MPDPITATIATVGSLGGAYMKKEGARKAGRAAMSAADRAADFQREQYDISKGYYQPYYETGTASSNRLAALLGVGGDTGAKDYGYLTQEFTPDKLQYDPGYLFKLNEGLKQIQGRAASRGGALSGATLKGVQNYAQGLAGTEYANAYERYRQRQQDIYDKLYGQQSLGFKSGGAMSDISNQYAANMANIALGKGNIEAQKTAAEYGAYGDMINVGTDLAMRKFGGGTTPQTTSTYGNYDLNNPFSTSWGKK